MPLMKAFLPLLVLCVVSCALAQEKGEGTQRWFFLQTNLLMPANIDKAEALLARAQQAGYNGMLLSDSKFCRLGQMKK